jgi:protein-L-isoaspartate(D-aspartate) O-methyltransferase
LPEVVLVAGGYHASARPAELFEDGCPFDAVVVGEGEKPLAKIVEMVAGGSRPRTQIFGSDPIEDLDELPPSDWSLLAKYIPVMRKVASQVMLYLSRGCPFDCAFCMERAKREVSWRAFSVERAVDEVRRLAAFADLTGMTVYVADALFGMRPSWRRAFLAALARERLPVQKIWLLIRVDLTDEEDLRLFAEANCAPGFGLESGDPALLGTIRKAGRLEDYLDRMRFIAARARELDVPWGANVIMGHPGETEATMRTTARYLEELFLDPRGTTGFLSVDPFRLYPGSPIDDERPAWESRFGTRFHRPHWWKDGDQEFLSEWVDPSESLDYRSRAALTHELLFPVVSRIRAELRPPRPLARLLPPGHRRSGPDPRPPGAPALHRPSLRLEQVPRPRARRDSPPPPRRRGRRPPALCPRHTLQRVGDELHPGDAVAASSWLASPVAAALRDVPRERFVPLDQVLESARDIAVPLDATGLTSASALHAYARTYQLAGLREGARVLDLGAGAGYGTALLARLVGPSGHVVSIELDRKLATAARAELAHLAAERAPSTASDSSPASMPVASPFTGLAPVTVLAGDSLAPDLLARAAAEAAAPFDAIVCGFAVPALPEAWCHVLREGGVIVAPVGEGPVQTLTRADMARRRPHRRAPRRGLLRPRPPPLRGRPAEQRAFCTARIRIAGLPPRARPSRPPRALIRHPLNIPSRRSPSVIYHGARCLPELLDASPLHLRPSPAKSSPLSRVKPSPRCPACAAPI